MDDHFLREFLNVIQERRSVRHFADEMPDDTQIQQLLEAARFAPSGANFQPWRFIVVKGRSCKEQMAAAVSEKLRTWQAATGQSLPQGYTPRHYVFFREAPVVIAVLYKPYPSSESSAWGAEEDGLAHEHVVAIQSAAAAIQTLLLAAHAMGLGGCWMDNPLIARCELEAILGVCQPWTLLALVPIGKPAIIPAAPRRKPLNVISRIISDSEGDGP